MAGTSPNFGDATVSVTERETSYEIVAELPGMAAQDLDVRFRDGTLTLRGEKREEKEQRDANTHISERFVESFERSFRMADDVDADKIEAKFERGVLTITLPKSAQAKKRDRKIAIR